MNDPTEAILQHYHDECGQYAKKFPQGVSMARTYLAYAALDLGFVLKTNDEGLKAALEARAKKALDEKAGAGG
jgi:hypothetical protein